MSLLEDLNCRYLDGLEFCTKAYSIFEKIRSTDGGISTLRMRSTAVAKRLLEEVLPICGYIHATYRAGQYIKICWVDGDQSYDAKVKASGWLVDEGFYPSESYIEVTCSVHPKDYLAREKLESDGYCNSLDGLTREKDGSVSSEVKIYRGLSFIDTDAECIVNVIKKRMLSLIQKIPHLLYMRL